MDFEEWCLVKFPKAGVFDAVITFRYDPARSAEDAMQALGELLKALARGLALIERVRVVSNYWIPQADQASLAREAQALGISLVLEIDRSSAPLASKPVTFEFHDGKLLAEVERGSERVPDDGLYHLLLNGVLVDRGFITAQAAVDYSRDAATIMAERWPDASAAMTPDPLA